MAVEELELIPGRFIGSNHPVFIVAEIGQNHQGMWYKVSDMDWELFVP